MLQSSCSCPVQLINDQSPDITERKRAYSIRLSVLYCQAGLREPCSAENILPPLEVSGVQIGSPSTTIHDSSTGLEGFGPWLGAATPGGRRRPVRETEGLSCHQCVFVQKLLSRKSFSSRVQSKHARNCLDSHKTTATASVVEGGRPRATQLLQFGISMLFNVSGGVRGEQGLPTPEQAAREGVAGHCHVAPHASR